MASGKKLGRVPGRQKYLQEEAEWDKIRDGTDDPEKLFPPKRYQSWTKKDRLEAQLLYEIDGLSHREIGERMGMKCWKNVSKWCFLGKWKKGSLSELAQSKTIDARLELARKMGLATHDQMLKAKELMEAKMVKEETKETKNGKVITKTELPDYKIQNEGLKRAMELTGTKIETAEVNHNVNGEIVHKYMLPEKGVVKSPKADEAEFKEVPASAGSNS